MTTVITQDSNPSSSVGLNPLVPEGSATGGGDACYIFQLSNCLIFLNIVMQIVQVAVDKKTEADAQEKSDYNKQENDPAKGELAQALAAVQSADKDHIQQAEANYNSILNQVNAQNDRYDERVQNDRTETQSCASAQSQQDQNFQGIFSQFSFASQLLSKSA